MKYSLATSENLTIWWLYPSWLEQKVTTHKWKTRIDLVTKYHIFYEGFVFIIYSSLSQHSTGTRGFGDYSAKISTHQSCFSCIRTVSISTPTPEPAGSPPLGSPSRSCRWRGASWMRWKNKSPLGSRAILVVGSSFWMSPPHPVPIRRRLHLFGEGGGDQDLSASSSSLICDGGSLRGPVHPSRPSWLPWAP